jgi:hypothetical protein
VHCVGAQDENLRGPSDRGRDGHKKTATTEVYVQRFNGPQADQRVRDAMSG